MARILLVEDSPTQSAMYSAYMVQAGFEVETVALGKEAIGSFSTEKFDLMVLDLKLPDMDGFSVLTFEGEATAPPTVVLTANGSVKSAVDAMRYGALDFLMKPCNGEKLCETVRDALERVQNEQITNNEVDENSKAEVKPKKSRKQGPSGFLGESPAMKNVFSLIENAAKSNASVFITGDSGTGKELCAQAIHKSSQRNNGPFVAINCAAIPRDLMESEIFGHRKGSFTGAVNDREGAAAMADGGTLFLDELCEMDLDLQAKLLRFIQTGAYRRVGDEHERQTDLRFVCATNRDPLAEVREKRFREDLYYRLHVIPISMPALRDRGSDIVMLAERFLKDFAKMENKSFESLSPDVKSILQTYGWPGNVRELQNVIQNVVVMNEGGVVLKTMLPAPLDGPLKSQLQQQVEAGEFNEVKLDNKVINLDTSMDEFLVRPMEQLEILAIDAAIRKFNGNVTRAAKALNISTSSIYRKKKSWDEQLAQNAASQVVSN